MAEGSTVSGAKKKSDLADFVIAIACALGIATTLLFLALLPVSRHLAGARDYVIYWATGQQLAHHANPHGDGARDGGAARASRLGDRLQGRLRRPGLAGQLHAEPALGPAARVAAGILLR